MMIAVKPAPKRDGFAIGCFRFLEAQISPENETTRDQRARHGVIIVSRMLTLNRERLVHQRLTFRHAAR